MKIAVTGAKGFIGRHVLAELSQHSIDVVAVCRKSSESLADAYVGRVLYLDLLEDSQEDQFAAMGYPDVLIHLAWGGLSNFRSLCHFEWELPRQYAFIRKLIRSGLSSLITIGTCLEYGNQSGRLSESLVADPTTPYGFAKNALRKQVEFLRAERRFAFTWCRLFYLFGSGQSTSSIIPQLEQAVERGDEFFNMSGGEQLRDYLDVREVAKYLVMLALAKADIGTVNICSGKPLSIRKLVESRIESEGWQIRLNLGHYPYHTYEPMAFWGDRCKLDEFIKSV